MEIYDRPTFRMASQQFDLVADHLEIPESDRGRLKFPKRSMTVALPIHCDDGSTRVFSSAMAASPCSRFDRAPIITSRSVSKITDMTKGVI